MNANLPRAALWYAQRGWYIIPLHTPLFAASSTGASAPGKLTGCTCEEYRRSERCKEKTPGLYDPNYHCPTPGKHPRLRDWEDKASKDPAQIGEWWRKWPNANIGLACGKSGLIALDADTYKEHYTGDSLLSQVEQETVTNLSGGGGEHLIYQMPEGARFGNQTHGLPAGIDIRGHGGMIVIPPSLHPSGQRYRWEDGYGPHELAPLPLPSRLTELLAEAHVYTPGKVAFTTNGSTPKPDLGQWHLSSRIVQSIFEGHNSEDRSKTDHSVITALLSHGATDNDVLAVFTHFPIGTQGKFAQSGERYLAHSIGKARAWLAEHPTPTTESLSSEPPPASDALIASMDDDGNARTLAANCPGQHLYTDALGWLIWTGTHWTTEAAEATVHSAMINTLKWRSRAAIDASKLDLLKAVTPSAKHTRDALYQYKPLVTASTCEFDSVPYLLNVANGVVDLRTGELTAHESSNRFTYCISTPYEPGALQDNPLWLDCLIQWFGGEPELAAYVRRCFGYSLTGDMREECLFYVYGPGRAGKGTLVNTVQQILGSPLAQGLMFDTFTSSNSDPQNFKLAPLRNARFVAASESKRSERLDEAAVKQLTGRDPIQAAFKRRDVFVFYPAFKIWLMTNHPVRGDVDDDAFWWRLRLITLEQSHMGDENVGLKDALLQQCNRAAILEWAILGSQLWYRDGLGKPPAAFQAAKDMQRAELDTVLQWMTECTQPALGIETPMDDLYRSYDIWCKDAGIKFPLSRLWFARKLAAKGHEATQVKRLGKVYRIYMSLRLWNDDFSGNDR